MWGEEVGAHDLEANLDVVSLSAFCPDVANTPCTVRLRSFVERVLLVDDGVPRNETRCPVVAFTTSLRLAGPPPPLPAVFMSSNAGRDFPSIPTGSLLVRRGRSRTPPRSAYCRAWSWKDTR